MPMKRFVIIINFLTVFTCGSSYGMEGGGYCDSMFYAFVLKNFNVNGTYVPLRIKVGDEVRFALVSNDWLSWFIEERLGINDSAYVVYMTKLLENQGVIEMHDTDFNKKFIKKVTMDTNLEKEVEKSRMKFIRKYFEYVRYTYYEPDFEMDSDSIVYKIMREQYFIKQEIPTDKKLCIIYLLLERNVPIYTIEGYDGEIGYIGPYKKESFMGNARIWRIEGKKAARLSRKYKL